MPASDALSQPLTQLAGIGPQSAAKLQKLGIHTVQDLLFHLPLRYQDRSRIQPINQLQAGSMALVCGTIDFIDSIQRGRNSVICRISDATGSLAIRFFHFSVHQSQLLKPGQLLGCYGEIRYGYAGLEMVHPDYKRVQRAEQLLAPQLLAIYPSTDGLSQTTLRKAIDQALAQCLAPPNALHDWLPASVRQRFGFPCLETALQHIHHPPASHANAQPHPIASIGLKRLAFEELLAHHLALQQGKQAYQRWPAPRLPANADSHQRFTAQLPFTLTAAQQRVIADIQADCQQAQPMLRLVQGDVGSGKTVVAAAAAWQACQAGYQVAVMAPTELLAEQHFQAFSRWFADSPHRVHLLTGTIKGKARQHTLDALAQGHGHISIGTHALFQDAVQFQQLGLIIIDEQHRFGVNQRAALRDKSQANGWRPHQLIMTATPIPRTLAMVAYADLDISIIDQLPPGRQPITTRVLPADRRDAVIERIAHWIAQQHQAYWVCTLIEDSEQLQCEAAETTAATLQQQLPHGRIGLVHGRMKAAEKEAVMQAFRHHQLDVLVATTVIEVGVDVPNASLMIIENAERLGLSQLHQLRGRVGRGSVASFCLLLYQTPLSETSRERLAILKDSQDGFVIAEKDLQLRGPGEVMGTRQTGQLQFKIADLSRDADLIDAIAPTAQQLPADAIQPLIQRWISSDRSGLQGVG